MKHPMSFPTTTFLVLGAGAALGCATRSPAGISVESPANIPVLVYAGDPGQPPAGAYMIKVGPGETRSVVVPKELGPTRVSKVENGSMCDAANGQCTKLAKPLDKAPLAPLPAGQANKRKLELAGGPDGAEYVFVPLDENKQARDRKVALVWLYGQGKKQKVEAGPEIRQAGKLTMTALGVLPVGDEAPEPPPQPLPRPGPPPPPPPIRPHEFRVLPGH